MQWRKYDRQQPIGEWRADARMAVLASMIGNSAGGKKGGGAFKSSEFMFWSDKHEQTAEEAEAVMKQAMAFASHKYGKQDKD